MATVQGHDVRWDYCDRCHRRTLIDKDRTTCRDCASEQHRAKMIVDNIRAMRQD